MGDRLSEALELLYTGRANLIAAAVHGEVDQSVLVALLAEKVAQEPARSWSEHPLD